MAVIQQKISCLDNQSPAYIPMYVVEVELGQPLPTISAFDEKRGSYYQRARCLVRLHTQPLGLVELDIEKDQLSPDEYAPYIWRALSGQINEHLRQDELEPVTALTAAGVPGLLTPQCIAERESFLQTAPFVSVIVATRDRPEYLARCLQALMALHYPRYEVIVVDNAPTTTATADLIRHAYADEPGIQYVRENRPGLSFARNRGILAAGGEILAFTDDDVVVDAYWLASLVRGFGAAEHVACVTGLILPLELETPAQFLFEAYGGFTRGFIRRIFDLKEHRPQLPLHPYIAGRFGTGASMAFTAAFLHNEGEFDLALGTGTRTSGGEDLAAFFRVVIGGYRLVYEPAALLYHLHRRDYAHLQKQIYYYGSGLTAYLTKIILENPLLLFNILAKAPYGLFFILSSRSPKNSKKSKNYPQELNALERKGMLYGPFAYVRSRWEGEKRKMLVDREASTQQIQSEDSGQAESFVPIRMIEIELEQPQPAITAFDEQKGCTYQRARCMVRLHTQPLGLVELNLEKDELRPDEYAPHIWQALSGQINAHLRQDGLSSVTALTAAGLPSLFPPQCIEERESFLQTAPFVSVIVATRDRPEQLSICLRSLLSLHYPRYEIIVVDNAPSTNAAADLIQQTYGGIPELHYIREDRPGLSWGHNCGMTVAGGEIFAFTDDDVVVDSYWLLELVKAFSSADNVACVTGLVLPLELETPAQILLEEYGGFSKGFIRRVYDMAENRAKQPLYPYTAGRFGSGACMAFRSAFLKSVGGFDPALQCGMDIAAFFQVITRGYKLVYEPAAIVHHLHHRDYAILRKQIYQYGTGLTAYLTKVILENPLLLFDILAKLPHGLFFILSSQSPKNSKKSKHYPQELNTIERKGMLYGPFAYVRSRWKMRKLSTRTPVLDETCAAIQVSRDHKGNP